MMKTEAKLIDEVIATERSWVKAHFELDLDTLASILSDSYRQIQADGSVIGKEALLESYRSGDRKWEVAESDEYDVRLYGETAVLMGRWRGVGENAGERFDYWARFLAVYALEEGSWKLVADVSVPLDE
jgi:ketosteroid isomerase-like protein